MDRKNCQGDDAGVSLSHSYSIPQHGGVFVHEGRQCRSYIMLGKVETQFFDVFLDTGTSKNYLHIGYLH